MRPNVLLIIFDTARADAFEPYGAAIGASPAVADLARRGRFHDAMFAPASWTLPSHASFFTGLLPRATGVADLPEGTPFGPTKALIQSHRDRLLPEVLRRAGYETLAASANVWISEHTGFATGFDSFVTIDSGRQANLHREDMRARLRWGLEGVRARVDDGAGEAGRVAREWVTERRERPFFGFVNLVECHSPYLPPRPYNDLGPVERLRAAEDARRHLTMGAIWKACAGGFEVPEAALERMRHLYARSIRLLDDWLARVLEGLDRAGRLDETLVIVTSDHGENLGEGGLMGHAFSLDHRLIRVPFVCAGPGAHSHSGPVSLVELPRLIADAVGIADHPWTNRLPEDGVAVAQFDPPGAKDHPGWLEAFADWGLEPEIAGERVGTHLTCATDGRLKLQLRDGREELFDLASDPLELTPAGHDGASEIEPLRRALAHPAVTAHGVGADPRSAEKVSEPSDEELRDLEDRMRLLGYM